MKTVGIIGAGESGVGAALLANKIGDKPFVSDFGKIALSYKTELIENNVRFEESGHSFDILSKCDVIIKSPGVPDRVDIISELKLIDIPVISELEYAYINKPADSKIVAITGSNGKTTTTILTHHLLLSGNVFSTKGGNLGICFSRLLLDEPRDVYVLEVSSFQLDGIDIFRSDVAVLLNITPDHLDRYQYQFDLYVQSKMRICENLLSDDIFIYNGDDQAILTRLNKSMNRVKCIPIEIKQLAFENFEVDNVALRGEHNAINASFAIEVARIFSISDDIIENALNTFQNDDHRMQHVANINGVEWINDSKATNVDSCYYALKAMEKPVVWIVGGTDKGNDYSKLMTIAKEKLKGLIALGSDNQKLLNTFSHFDIVMKDMHSMKDALYEADKIAEEGDVVLLSPACASFDLFENYEDRGYQFIDGVWDLLK